MNGVYLYEAVGRISPGFIEEAEKQRFPKPLWRKLLPLAACLAVVLGLYVGIPALLYQTASHSTPQPTASAVQEEAQVPSILDPASPTTGAAILSPWLNVGSLLLGLTAWGLPIVSLFRAKTDRRRHSLTITSCIACILSLLLQLFETLHRVNIGDFAALDDTMWFVMLASVALVIGTAVLNMMPYLAKRSAKPE